MSGLSPERWEQVSSILDEVLELPPEEVEGALTKLCGDDAELRHEVEVMLDACARAEHLMERPPALNVKGIIGSVGNPDRGKIEPGDLVGAYRIIELLGRGGMGAVYLAERADGEFERRVALKVVKRGMDSEEIIDRFRSERQILAGLEHPNIASLLDGGITADGRPFFAMELASGEPIDSYCDRLRLTLRQRIELFLVVCDAVQHAHRNLVVHRDLKPGNVIVTPDGEVKLLDFGIAKVLDPSHGSDQRTTALGVRLTPEYAAPEQIVMGPTTTATDVYSLGVVLYELLSGKRPYVFTNGSMSEIEDVVCKTDPRRPSTRVVFRDAEAKEETSGLPRSSWLRSTNPGALRQSLSGDLDSIILKALEKEPQRRYGSAAELKQDLENYIHGHPVEARSQTRLYRLGKFVRRNVLVVGLGTAAALALVAGAGAATWFGLAAQRQGALAAEAAVRAERTRDFAVSLFEPFNPAERGGTALTPRELVERGLGILDTIQNQPLLKGSSLNAMGQIAFGLGERNLADSIFGLALGLDIADSVLAAPMRADALVGRAAILNERRDSTSLALLRRALALRRLSSDSLRLNRDLIALASSLTIHYQPGSPGRAEARDLLHQLDDADLEALPEGNRQENLGDLWYYEGQWDSALAYYDRAIEVRAAEYGPDYVRNGPSHWGRGAVFLGMNQPREAERALREALRIVTATHGEQHPWVAGSWLRLARSLLAQDRASEAAAAAREGLAAADPSDATNGANRVGGHEVLSRSLFALGRHLEAHEEVRRATELLPSTSGINPADRVRIWTLRSETEQVRGLMEDAANSLKSALTVAAPRSPSQAYERYVAQRIEALEQLIPIERRLGREGSAEQYRAELLELRAMPES